MRRAAAALPFLLFLPVVLSGASETLLKDVVRLEGTYTNKLTGVGLVTGLAGTGDKSESTRRLAQQFYKEMGNTFDLKEIDIKNMAAVVVTADLPTSKARGDTVDVTVSSLGGASSLKNGKLLPTNLVGPGSIPAGGVKPVLAFATGSVQVGDEKAQLGGAGPAGHLTVGLVVNGATVVNPNPGGGEVLKDGRIALLLLSPDFANAQRVAQTVNAEFEREQRHAAPAKTSVPIALATGPNRVEVTIPEAYRQVPADFISRVLELSLSLVKERARVVVNARTGIVTYTADVRLSAVQVSFGGRGEGKLKINEGGTLSDLLDALDQVATPARKLEVLNHLHAMGALRAELVVE